MRANARQPKHVHRFLSVPKCTIDANQAKPLFRLRLPSRRHCLRIEHWSATGSAEECSSAKLIAAIHRPSIFEIIFRLSFWLLRQNYKFLEFIESSSSSDPSETPQNRESIPSGLYTRTMSFVALSYELYVSSRFFRAHQTSAFVIRSGEFARSSEHSARHGISFLSESIRAA